LLKKIEKVVILGLNSRKVYETANPHIAILGHFNHKRELLEVTRPLPPQGAKAILSPFRGYSKTGPSGPGFLFKRIFKYARIW